MNLKDLLLELLDQKNLKQRIFKVLSFILTVAGFFIILGILFPTFVTMLINILWVILLVVVFVFCGLGLLVLLGMKKNVSRILDILLEGSMTLIDFINFVRELWFLFIKTLKEFLVYVAPVFAAILGAIIFVLMLILYKSVGRYYDVTIMTIAITIFFVVLVEFLNRHRVEAEIEPERWVALFKMRFQNSFADAFEVVLFAFFLTMDSTKLFFFPANLNIPIYAKVWDYDFMRQGFVIDSHLKVTLTLIIVTICSEIFRYTLKVLKISYGLYKDTKEQLLLSYEANPGDESLKMNKLVLIKDSIRRGFICAKNDTTKFITFNTFLLLVFLVFPRLKLLAMSTASGTSLLMNVFTPRTTVSTKQNDLLSRILARIFRLNE